MQNALFPWSYNCFAFYILKQFVSHPIIYISIDCFLYMAKPVRRWILLLLLFPGDPPLPALSILRTQSDGFLLAARCHPVLSQADWDTGWKRDGARLSRDWFATQGVWISLPD